MPQTVAAEVLEGLKALQTKIEEGDRDLANYQTQLTTLNEVIARETTRVDGLKTKLAAAKGRLSIDPAEKLSFDEDTLVVKTATEVAAEEAAK